MARLRMIAGPNGSGKTTLTQHLRDSYNMDWGYYINADEIEKSLRFHGSYSFQKSPIKLDNDEFIRFYKAHSLYPKSAADISIADNTLILGEPLPAFSYFPTLLTDFLRNELIWQGNTFSFETVMSDHHKVSLLQLAKQAGYRNYLYYICTKDPATNKDRVKDRVRKKGHDVPEEKIVERYQRSLDNLLPALRFCHRAYFFDNSGAEFEFLAELGAEQLELKSDNIPNWLIEAVLNKL